MREENDNQSLHSLKKDWEQLESLASHERISFMQFKNSFSFKNKSRKSFPERVMLIYINSTCYFNGSGNGYFTNTCLIYRH